jgi:plasmid replication initiation protein
MEWVMLSNKSIRKHVSIIHAYSLMSVLQRKIVNVLLYEAIKGEARKSTSMSSVAVECKIPFSTLTKAIKFNSNNNQYVKEAVDGLASLMIEWNLLKDKAPTDISFLNLRILHGSPTFYKDNTLTFSFHKVLLDLVSNPSVYGTIDIDLQSDFESKYSHALYENSTRFLNLQKGKVIQLDTFRKILGVKEDKYLSAREFTRNVITPSVEEVNDRSNFIVSLDAIKSGRKTTGYHIGLKYKNGDHSAVEREGSLTEDNKVNAEIKRVFGIVNMPAISNILYNHSEEYIQEKIVYTIKHAKKESSGYYPVAYFISAVRNDYKEKGESLLVKSNVGCAVIQGDEWEKELSLLESDRNHWRKLYESVKSSKNETQIKQIGNILSRCDQKIEYHHLNKPNKEKVG